jgi:indolepyruvate ferredoxin oxidoreductase beta subunit
MKALNIYLSGVGGQGIGLLSEVLGQSCLAAGHEVRGSDTHGIAQRHGPVVSHLRLGPGPMTPRVPPGQADVVVALERLEALRGAVKMLKAGGTVVYYDTVYQPIHVRMGRAQYPTVEELAAAVSEVGGKVARIKLADLDDPRMQNVALFARVVALGLIDGLDEQIAEQALREAVPPKVLDANLEVFKRALALEQPDG